MSAVSGNALTTAFGFVHALCGCRVLEQLLRRAARAAQQLSSAVGTASLQRLLAAARAERAFKGADPRVGGITGKVGVAAFAVGTQLQHGSLPINRVARRENAAPRECGVSRRP